MKSGNRDKTEGSAKNLQGDIKKGTGKALNDPEMEAEGRMKKTEGDAQKLKGDAKKSVGH
jgi:uncharacterized protein YjbJ (UPF0337 family)